MTFALYTNQLQSLTRCQSFKTASGVANSPRRRLKPKNSYLTILFKMSHPCKRQCTHCSNKKNYIKPIDWLLTASSFKELGTKRIVFHGITNDSKDIVKRVQAELNIKTVLSLKDESLEEIQSLLPFLNEIELRHDDPKDKERIEKSVKDIKYLQKKYPEIHITVKTVVSSQNNNLLSELVVNLEDLSFYDRNFKWKVYRIKLKPNKQMDTINGTQLISKEQFKASFSKMYSDTLWADYPFIEKYDENEKDYQLPRFTVCISGYTSKFNNYL